jgi:hypothetical protein
MNKVIQEIKNEYRKRKLVTVFYVTMLPLAILSYLKPSSTASIWKYLGLTAINFSILVFAIFLIWWFYMRKK